MAIDVWLIGVNVCGTVFDVFEEVFEKKLASNSNKRKWVKFIASIHTERCISIHITLNRKAYQ